MVNVLLVGSGAREHALCWKLRQSHLLSSLYVAPGNSGTSNLAYTIPIPTTDLNGLVQAARKHSIDLTIVGPETPLADGIVDLFQSEGLAIFGPTQAASRIESSKAFAKGLMTRHHIPTGKTAVFSSYAEARQAILIHDLPVVVKADGLAAGKGVTICSSREAALEALDQCMKTRLFGEAGDQVLIEECLQGLEVSVFAFSDGRNLSSLVAACDYKRVADGDHGSNTGGMGSYSPPRFWTPELERQVRDQIMQPTCNALAEEGYPYRGVLYAGLMITNNGPQVLEFNCRLGDPEAQVILPRMKSDLLEVLLATVNSNLGNLPVKWHDEACVGVVMASKGYPGDYLTGLPISGLDTIDNDVMAFHAGTRSVFGTTGQIDSVLTNGGRVLTLTAQGPTLDQARERVYTNIERIHFVGAHYRSDIGSSSSLQTEIAAFDFPDQPSQ